MHFCMRYLLFDRECFLYCRSQHQTVRGGGSISEGLFTASASQPATVLSGGISAASLLTLLAFGSIWRGIHKVELHVSMGKKLINLPRRVKATSRGVPCITSMLEAKKPHGGTVSVAVGETLKYSKSSFFHVAVYVGLSVFV